MKKIFSLLLAASVAVLSLSAQETEKKQYLPEEGDWSIGFDAKPILNFVGNVFNGATNNELESFGGEPSLTDNGPTVSLMGKYMLTDNFAVKANLGVLVKSVNNASYIQDDAATILDPLSNNKVADYTSSKERGLSLMAGVEYRVGKKRIQGVFGGGLLLGVKSNVVKYSYGNQMTDINQHPTVANNSVWAGNYRTLKEFSDVPNFYAGLVGTAGVEFFVAPKVALGAEVSLVAAYNINQQRYTLSEGYNTSTEIIETKTDLVSPRTGSFNLETKNLGGSLYLAFYF